MSRGSSMGAIDAPRDLPNTASAPVVVLLVETERGVAAWLANVLAGFSASACRFEWLTRLSEGIERLGHGGVDVVLIGSSPPGRDAGEAFERIRRIEHDALILPLTEVGGAVGAARGGDESSASDAQREGRWLLDVLHYVGQRKGRRARTARGR